MISWEDLDPNESLTEYCVGWDGQHQNGTVEFTTLQQAVGFANTINCPNVRIFEVQVRYIGGSNMSGPELNRWRNA